MMRVRRKTLMAIKIMIKQTFWAVRRAMVDLMLSKFAVSDHAASDEESGKAEHHEIDSSLVKSVRIFLGHGVVGAVDSILGEMAGGEADKTVSVSGVESLGDFAVFEVGDAIEFIFFGNWDIKSVFAVFHQDNLVVVVECKVVGINIIVIF